MKLSIAQFDIDSTESQVPSSEDRSTERLGRAGKSNSRLGCARVSIAALFHRVMKAHEGNPALSNAVVARAAGVDKKIVKAWRSGDKPMPAAALAVLPPTIFREVVTAIAKARNLATVVSLPPHEALADLACLRLERAALLRERARRAVNTSFDLMYSMRGRA